VLTDPNGLPVRKTFYGIYGEIRSNVELTGGAPDPAHKYTGKRFDPNVALADYGARWYDPELAVFTQPDPIVANPFDPQQLNRFAYVRGDPLNLSTRRGTSRSAPARRRVSPSGRLGRSSGTSTGCSEASTTWCGRRSTTPPTLPAATRASCRTPSGGCRGEE
jgi:RHS repeat-associated protein